MIKGLTIPTPGSVIEYSVMDKISVDTVRKCFITMEGNVLVELDKYHKLIDDFKSVNVGHITKVIKHSNIVPKKLNMYDDGQNNDVRFNEKYKEKFITVEISHCLRHMNMQLLTMISLDKFKHEFNKSGYGMVLIGQNKFTNLNRKKFKSWLRRNVYKIVLTQKEQKQRIKEDEEQWQKIYIEDMEKDFEFFD